MTPQELYLRITVLRLPEGNPTRGDFLGEELVDEILPRQEERLGRVNIITFATNAELGNDYQPKPGTFQHDLDSMIAYNQTVEGVRLAFIYATGDGTEGLCSLLRDYSAWRLYSVIANLIGIANDVVEEPTASVGDRTYLTPQDVTALRRIWKYLING